MLNIILKVLSIEHHASTYCVLTHTLEVDSKSQKNSERSHVEYHIKGNGA